MTKIIRIISATVVSLIVKQIAAKIQHNAIAAAKRRFVKMLL